MEKSFMIDWDPEKGRWVEKRPNIKNKKPWEGLMPQTEPRPAQLTIKDYLQYVVSGSSYKPNDIVAIGIGSTHFIHGEKLHAVYLTPRGMGEATGPDEDLKEPYDRLEKALKGPITVMELNPDNLERVVKSTGLDNQRTFINWGGPDSRNRVVAIYSKDVTFEVFKRG